MASRFFVSASLSFGSTLVEETEMNEGTEDKASTEATLAGAPSARIIDIDLAEFDAKDARKTPKEH
jgi:hypothetical protein